MSKKFILLGLLIISISFTSLVSAHEPADTTDKPTTDSTVQTSSDKKDCDNTSEEDCCKKEHPHDKETK